MQRFVQLPETYLNSFLVIKSYSHIEFESHNISQYLSLTEESFYYLIFFHFFHSFHYLFPVKIMDRQQSQEKCKTTSREHEEVNSTEWEFIKMTEQEEDLIYRMHRLVGDRWDLIAGRIPGRKAEEIERFWIMRHNEGFAKK